jgi:hypothetical protein
MNAQADTNLPAAVIACRVMQSPLQRLLPEPLRQRTLFLDYGLHRSPDVMRETLQAALEEIAPARRVILGYGLCGNGLDGIRSGRHTLIVPKVDDCIALLMGSRRAYLQQFAAEPGTYYLSTGWLEAGSHPLSEYREYAAAYGKEEAEWIMDAQYRHYRRLVYIGHSRDELAHYRSQALEVARFCERWDMHYEEMVGSDAYFRRMVKMIEDPHHEDDGFVVVPPGGRIRQRQFQL